MTAEQEHRAKEAQRLLNEPLLIEGMDAVRRTAMAALCEVDPSDSKEVARLQACANNTEEIRQWLLGLTLSVKPTGYSPNEPSREDHGS
jgi:hypothetical protein